MENFSISKGEFLYEENGFYYIRSEKGTIEKIVKNRFKHNEIVKTTNTHYSEKTFTRVIDPSYVESRGWIYGESYISRNGRCGGTGFWNNEDHYTNITDPGDILYAERFMLKEELLSLKAELKNKEERYSKVQFALDLTVPNYKGVIDRCRECGEYYDENNKGDVNIKICMDCKKNKNL